MLTLRDLVKDRKVYSIDAARTVLEAARFMMEHNIGALPVLRNGELAGIFSERDIMNRVVAVGRTPGTTAVSEVMTANPRAVPADETIEECLFIMREFGFRHLPIVDGKELKGVVSLARCPHAPGCRDGAQRAPRLLRAGSGLDSENLTAQLGRGLALRFHSRFRNSNSPSLGGSLKGNSKTLPASGTRRTNSSCRFQPPSHLLSVSK